MRERALWYDALAMVDSHKHRAFEYRQRAEELRANAEEMFDPETRARLLQLAEEYDRLAALQEGLSE